MTTVLLYWNHICVLHKGEKQFLDRLAERLSNEGIDLRVRYFGLGYRNICRNTWPDRMPFSQI